MSPLSGRYAAVVVVLLLLAIVPVAWHADGSQRYDDCPNPDALTDPGRFGGTSNPDWLANTRPRNRWNEGHLPLAPPLDGSLYWALIRSHKPARLYLRPHTLGISLMEPEETVLEWIEQQGERLPVYLATERRGTRLRVAGYVYLWEGRPVSRPFLAMLRSAVPDLVQGTPPMTLLVAAAAGRSQDRAALEGAIRGWLADAWQTYRRVCAAPPVGAL